MNRDLKRWLMVIGLMGVAIYFYNLMLTPLDLTPESLERSRRFNQYLLIIASILVALLALLYLWFQASMHTGHISKAPGVRLLSIVDFLFSPATVEETFKPTVADWQNEYFEALKQKRFLKARWISVRYTYRFILAMGLSKVFSIIKSFKSVIK